MSCTAPLIHGALKVLAGRMPLLQSCTRKQGTTGLLKKLLDCCFSRGISDEIGFLSDTAWIPHLRHCLGVEGVRFLAPAAQRGQ